MGQILLFIFTFISLSALAADTISISVVGDIMIGTTYPFNGLPENNGAGLFDEVTPWLKSSHIAFGNLEGTLFDGKPQPDGKATGKNRFLFKTPPTYGSILKEAGFSVMSLANNHVNDFGLAGVTSTKATLRKLGIKFSSKAGEVAEFTVGPSTVSLIATDFYKAPRSMTDSYDTLKEIKELKDKGQVVIVSSHVGAEGAGAEYVKPKSEIYLGENRGDSMRFARAAIDAGADLIVMHGPHVPRGLEMYKVCLFIYSLGNFVTGKGISLDGYSKLAPLVRVELTHRGELVSGTIVPFVQKRDPQRIELDKTGAALFLMKRLSQEQFKDTAPQFLDQGHFVP